MGLLLRPKKAIRHYLMRTSLKNILLWLFIPVFVLCILVNLVITNILVRRQVRENALVSISEVVSQTKYHLDYRLYSTFEQMVLFEQSPDVAALITQYDEEETGKLERIVTVFNNLSRIYNSSYSVLDSVFVAIQQGDKPIDIFYRSDYPPSRSDFSFSLVMNGEPLIEQGGRSYQWFNLHENNINPNTYTDNRVASLYKVFGDRESKSRALFLF
ncbi:MAG: hypothetical protein FWC45_04600, partial [Treponema sp.]|nr:hypothetical protein [Treponema sp.]